MKPVLSRRVFKRAAPLAAAVLACLSWGAASAANGETVACHYINGGETKVLHAAPVASPYAVPTVSVEPYFLMRVVWLTQPAHLASVHVYTYADDDSGPVIIHHAEFPVRLARRAGKQRFGFTGMQRVYEPLRESELEYWCEFQRRTGGKK